MTSARKGIMLCYRNWSALYRSGINYSFRYGRPNPRESRRSTSAKTMERPFWSCSILPTCNHALYRKELDCKILYRIAILCEQYDCHVVVEPWKYIWLQLQNEANYRYEPGEEERIYIDWAFGRENIFAKMTTDLVRLLEVCPNGEPFVFGCGDFPKKCLASS